MYQAIFILSFIDNKENYFFLMNWKLIIYRSVFSILPRESLRIFLKLVIEYLIYP